MTEPQPTDPTAVPPQGFEQNRMAQPLGAPIVTFSRHLLPVEIDGTRYYFTADPDISGDRFKDMLDMAAKGDTDGILANMDQFIALMFRREDVEPVIALGLGTLGMMQLIRAWIEHVMPLVVKGANEAKNLPGLRPQPSA